MIDWLGQELKSTEQGVLKVQVEDFLYTDFTERTEFFLYFTEVSVLSAGYVYRKKIFSSVLGETKIYRG
jgi:hypothetical protein